MQILLGITYCLLFILVIRNSRFFTVGKFPAWILAGFFILKCISGILLGLLYTSYYTNHSDADTFKFFTDSRFIFDTLTTKPYDFFRMFTGINGSDKDLLPYYIKMDAWLNTSPLYNDNRTMIRLNTLFRFFSLGYYNIHVIFLNFISFTGLFCLYKTFADYLPTKKIELLFLIFLMPSVLFWGSGLLKDGLLIAAFGAMIYSFNLLMRYGLTFRRLLIFVAALLVLTFIKVYVTVLILPGLFAWVLTRKSKSLTVALTFVGIYAAYFIIAFNLYHFNDDYNVAALLFYKQKNFVEIGIEHSATMITFPKYECSGPSIFLHSPWAFSNTLFRPFIWEVHGNPMVLLSALENIFLIILIIILFLSFDRKGKKIEPVVMLSIAFILCLFALIGLITPVLGAIVRYRIIALPFFIFVLTYFYSREKLFTRLPFLKSHQKI